jgi:hypothetical protein
MAIVQISKIQQRSGNLVDLPQLDDAELGWANDARRLFIGKTTPNENVEILTSYSTISFSQIDGAVGNLNISNLTAANGQVLSFDGSDWVNRGGIAGGLLTFGDVGNVKIDGGAIGYVLQTDGTGNLSWSPKGTLVTGILNISKANPAVVTSVNDNFFANAAQITILDPQGMTELAGGIYFAEPLTSTTFALYTDSGLSTGVNSSSYNAYSYTTVSATTVSTNVITVANSSPFTVGAAVKFIGNMSTSNISNTATYYVQAKPNSTSLKIATSADANAANVVPLQTTSGLTAEVYQSDGQAVSTLGSTVTFSPAGGTDTTIQYNELGSLQGSGSFTYDYGNSILTLAGNANVGNLNATGVSTATRFISNIANGTPPLQVTSITQVANLNVATSGSVVNGNSNVNIPAANGNVTISAVGNANILVVTGTGANIAGTLNATGNANVGNLGTATAIITTGNITTINSGLLQNGNSNVTLTANANVSVFVAGNATARAVFTATGANIAGTANITGNANVGNLGTSGLITATGNVSGGNLTTGGVVAATGNVSGGNLTTGGVVAATGNVSGGNLTTGGVVAATGNVSGGNLTTAGALSVTGNANVGNLGTGGLIVATGNVSGGNLTTGGVVAATGNVSGGNLTTAGALSVTGNANVGNIGAVTGVFTGNVTAGNVYANSGTIGASLLTGTLTTAAQPNITSVGTLTSLGVNGTVTGVAFTANTGIFTGNGSGLTNIAGANVTGTVSAATTAGTVTTAAQPNITSVGTLTSLSVSGALTTTQITAGANTTAGNITGNWTLTAGSRLTATYADLAEYYEADVKYEPGTVLMFGGEKEVTLADDGTSRVAGVVSTNPAYVMNSTCPGLLTAVALQGRVPCKVRGKISKGDMLISGGNGFARPNQFPSMGTVIGKALEDFDGYEGVIEVAVGRL